MLAAVMEGFGVRHLGDPSAEILGASPTGNLAGEAVMAILNNCLERAGTTGGRSLREEFDERDGAPNR